MIAIQLIQRNRRTYIALLCMALSASGCAMTPEQQEKFNEQLIKILENREKQDGKHPVAEQPEQSIHACSGKRINVSNRPIDTTRSRSRTTLVSGDTEINSDDWSEIGFQYSIIQRPTIVELQLEWTAQELNRNKSRGDTRFSSSSSHVLYEVGPECHGAKIARIEGEGLGRRGGRTLNISGKQHDYVAAGSYGQLRDVGIRFDRRGRDDQRTQALRADYAGMVVVLE